MGKPFQLLTRRWSHLQAKWADARDAWQAARVDPAQLVRQTISGRVMPGSFDALCLYAHFDPAGRIDPYVQYALNAWHQLGVELVLVSTGPSLNPSDVEAVKPWCRMIVHRQNLGTDFGSWRVGMALVPDWASYDRLILANDSVYGPLFPLNEVFATMGETPVWGMTDSWAIAWHVQSYVLVLQQSALADAPVAAFLEGIRFYRDKQRIIRDYEVGFSQWLLRHDIWPEAYRPYRDTRRWIMRNDPHHPERQRLEQNICLNPTHAFWDTQIRQFRFPYLKRDLLQKNPTHRPDLYRWDEVIQAAGSNYPTTLIENHLKRNPTATAV